MDTPGVRDHGLAARWTGTGHIRFIMARILLVSSEGMIGGAEISLLLLVKYLRARLALSAACPAPSPLSTALAGLGVDCHPLPQPPKGSYGSWHSAAYWPGATYALARAILKAKACLVHANTFHAGAVSLPAALATRRKLVLHARDLTDFGFLTRLLGRYCRRIIAVSQAVECALISGGGPADRIDLVYNGVDSQNLGSGNMPATPRPADTGSDFTFGHIGQFAPWKNHSIFLQAAERVASELPQARFVLVGEDLFGRDRTYERRLHRLAEQSSAAARIHFWGWRTNMEEVWPAIDCLVHTAEREAFGRVIVEAMAHGVPVIAVACGGPAEIIQTGRTGLLVPPGDVRALGRAMLRIARDLELARRIAEAGRRHVLSNFSAEQTAARVQGIYEQVLSM